MGSPGAHESSRTASNGGFENLRVKTIQFAMVDMLAHPPAGFEDVVREHFRLKQHHIRATMAAWTADAQGTAADLAVQVVCMWRMTLRERLVCLRRPLESICGACCCLPLSCRWSTCRQHWLSSRRR